RLGGDRQQTHFEYDSLGLLSARTEGYQTPDTATTEFRYGPNGEVVEVRQPTGTWTYEYDKLGRLSASTPPSDTTPPGGSLRPQSWSYDGLGRINDHFDGVRQWHTDWNNGLARTLTPSQDIIETLTDSRGRLL